MFLNDVERQSQDSDEIAELSTSSLTPDAAAATTSMATRGFRTRRPIFRRIDRLVDASTRFEPKIVRRLSASLCESPFGSEPSL